MLHEILECNAYDRDPGTSWKQYQAVPITAFCFFSFPVVISADIQHPVDSRLLVDRRQTSRTSLAMSLFKQVSFISSDFDLSRPTIILYKIQF